MWKKDEKSETGLYIMGWCICSVGAACDISARDGDEIVTVVRTVHDPYVHRLLLSGLRRDKSGSCAFFRQSAPLLPLSPGGFVHSGIWYLVYGEPDRAAAFTRENQDRDAFPNGLSVGCAWLDCCKFSD